MEQREKTIPLPVSDIAYLYLENAVIKIATLKGQQYFITSTPDELEQILDSELF